VLQLSPSPATTPVTAWFNGGPGCSSLEGGFQEMGALFVDEADPTKLVANPFAWTNISSMLFIEAPACVGYSYADTLAGCSHNDSSQAVDNAAALRVFFSLYPELAANDFFITGESYAGIYVPTTAQQVYLGNAAGATPRINLRGIAVGNGCYGHEAGLCAFSDAAEIATNVPYYAGHGLISPTTFSTFTADCAGAAAGGAPSAACLADVAAAHDEVGPVNIYNIYGDCIVGAAAPTRVDKASGARVHARAPVPVRGGAGGPIACIDETISHYLGAPAVAAALHVIPTLNWAVCGSNSSFDYTRTEKDERVDVYPTLINDAKIRVLIYNGEADACVPWLDNEYLARSMGYAVEAGWRAWESNSQVAGYVVKYASNLTFATVKGAGHMVSCCLGSAWRARARVRHLPTHPLPARFPSIARRLRGHSSTISSTARTSREPRRQRRPQRLRALPRDCGWRAGRGNGRRETGALPIPTCYTI
jgi:carboxypeptidase C (cathepsin A)